MVGNETAEGALGIADLALLGGHEVVYFDGPIALTEGGDGIAVGAVAIKFVSGAALEMQLQLALTRVGNYNRPLCQGEPRTAFPAGIREKDAMPLSSAGGDV